MPRNKPKKSVSFQISRLPVGWSGRSKRCSWDAPDCAADRSGVRSINEARPDRPVSDNFARRRDIGANGKYKTFFIVYSSRWHTVCPQVPAVSTDCRTATLQMVGIPSRCPALRPSSSPWFAHAQLSEPAGEAAG